MRDRRRDSGMNDVGGRANPRTSVVAKPAPDPEVVAKPKRRQFTAEYRLRILEEADRCMQPGEAIEGVEDDVSRPVVEWGFESVDDLPAVIDRNAALCSFARAGRSRT